MHRATLRHIRALLVVLTLLAVGAAFHVTAPVTRPLVLALFFAALCWPLQRWLEGHLPRALALTVTLSVFLGVAASLGWAVAESADEVQESLTGSPQSLDAVAREVTELAASIGLGPMVSSPTVVADALRSGLKAAALPLIEVATGAVLTIAILGLSLLEVGAFRRKLGSVSDRGDERWPRVLRRVAQQAQRYMVVRTGIGALTGLLVAGGAFAIGLRFWFIWGVINFLLNYIPTLGSILGVIPPVLFAWVSTRDPGMVLATFGVVGGVQLVMGNWVDPLLQGRYLELSPVVVLLSVTFWGWLWGVVGALVGVPLTMAIVVACQEHDGSRFVARLLTRGEDEGGPAGRKGAHGEPEASPTTSGG